MVFSLSRRAAAVGAVTLALAAGGAFLLLRRQVRGAFVPAAGATAPLDFQPLPEPASVPPRWGGGEVTAVALTPEAFLTAGASGVRDDRGEIGRALPTLRASAMALWRGEPIVGLEAGGLFLRRGGSWEALRCGFGTLHARALLETPGGELLIGAREGLFRAAWGARSMDRLDGAPVQSLALAPGGAVIAGGETGLRRVEGGRVTALASPDPWIQWVGVSGTELAVLTPLGLARGPLGGALAPVGGCEGARAAAYAGATLLAVVDGRLVGVDPSGRLSELILPARARAVMTASDTVFVDTEAGLYRRAEGRWELARPRPPSLPGSAHVGALAFLGRQVVVGLFDQGLVVGDPASEGSWTWRAVPGGGAWGVNALLPSGGGLAVASLRGAARFDGQGLRPLGPADGGAAFALAPCGGGLAIGYGQGVALPDGRLLSAFHGLPGNQALALLQAPDGLLFVGTPTGLGAIRGSGGSWRVAWRVTAADGLLPNAWVDALADYRGHVYLGTVGGGVARRDAPEADTGALGTYAAFPETAGLKASPGCLVVAGGALYLGTDGQGLFRLGADGGRFQPVAAALPSPRITSLLPAPDGLLVGTDEGLAELPLPATGEGD